MHSSHSPRVALVTGAAKRLGRCIAETLHKEGWNIVAHYQHSATEANMLCERLNNKRNNSCKIVHADLSDKHALDKFAQQVLSAWGSIDALINNASSFSPDEVSSDISTDTAQSSQHYQINAEHPYRLAKLLSEDLKASNGCVINLLDIYADRPLANFANYSASKAAAASFTKSLAMELAPEARANGIAPGAILWPDESLSYEEIQSKLALIPLARCGEPGEIAKAVSYLCGANYITGQVITVDGGRSLNL